MPQKPSKKLLKIAQKLLKITEKVAENKENLISVNTMENVNYSSKDLKGNEYLIFANKGEIEFSDKNIIF